MFRTLKCRVQTRDQKRLNAVRIFATTTLVIGAICLMAFAGQQILWFAALGLSLITLGPRREQEDGSPPIGGHSDELWSAICARRDSEARPADRCGVVDTIWEPARDGLRLTDSEGRILAVNQAYCEMAGLDRSQLLGRLFTCVYPDAEREEMLMRYKGDLAQGRLRSFLEREWITPDGRHIWVEVQMSRVDTSGRTLVLASFRDVSDRKRLQQQLQEKIELARSFMASTSVGLAVLGPDGQLRQANSSFYRMFQLDDEKTPRAKWNDLIEISMPPRSIVSPQISALIDCGLQCPNCGAGHRTLTFEKSGLWGGCCFLGKPRRPVDADRIHVEINPMRDDKGSVTGYSVVAVDQSRTEQLERHARLDNLLDAMLFKEIEALTDCDSSEGRQPRTTTIGILKRLALLCEADLASVYVYDFEKSVCKRELSWERIEKEASPHGVNEFPLDLFRDWLTVHRAGQWVEIENSEKVSPIALREILEREGIVSTLSVPVWSGGQCTGFIALHAVGRPRRFGPEAAALVGAVARATEGIRKLQQTRWELMESRTRLENALQESDRLRAEAERANRAKTEFLAAMSHEIRTPLNGVIGVLSLLGATELPDNLRQLVTTAHESALALLGLLGDLIDLARLEGEQQRSQHADFSPLELLEQCLAAVAPAAAAKRLTLASQIDALVPERLRGDQPRLRQVLLNLLGNAVKFTSQGYVLLHISLQWDKGKPNIVYAVRDTGIGIPSEEQKRVFDRYYQATNRPSGARGFGLGLSISERLVELMGGKIEVRSQPGRGSEFLVIFPLSPESLPARPYKPLAGQHILLLDPDDSRREILAWQLHQWGAAVDHSLHPGRPTDAILVTANWLESQEKTPEELCQDLHSLCSRIGVLVPAASSLALKAQCRQLNTPIFLEPLRWRSFITWVSGELRAPEAPELTASSVRRTLRKNKPRILLVDDNPMNRRVASALLGKLGCEVDTASNGLEALEQLTQTTPDLVLLDLEMPVLDGEQTARRIRAQGWHDLPVLALSAHVLPEEMQRAFAAGMQGFVPKPVSLLQLKQALEAWLPGQPEDDLGVTGQAYQD